MTYHNYNGYKWYSCDECGAVTSGTKPDFVGDHWAGPVYNKCVPRCEAFCEYDSNGKIVKYQGVPIKEE